MECINTVLSRKIGEGQSYFVWEPLHPIFDGITSIRARALFAIAIGCDVLPGGISGFASAATVDIKLKIT